jgi:hypothetical protein
MKKRILQIGIRGHKESFLDGGGGTVAEYD